MKKEHYGLKLEYPALWESLGNSDQEPLGLDFSCPKLQDIIASVVGWPFLKPNYNALSSSYRGYVKNHFKKDENSPF